MHILCQKTQVQNCSNIPCSLIYWDRVLGICTYNSYICIQHLWKNTQETVKGIFPPEREMYTWGEDGRKTLLPILFTHFVASTHVQKLLKKIIKEKKKMSFLIRFLPVPSNACPVFGLLSCRRPPSSLPCRCLVGNTFHSLPRLCL